MATVYCAQCIWLVKRGGVYYCGNSCSEYGSHDVNPTFAKYCPYFKGNY